MKIFSIKQINDYANSYVLIHILGIKIRFKHYFQKKKGKITKNSLTFVNYCGVKNIGDILSSPSLYFDFKNYKKLDYLSILHNQFKPTEKVIIGGGVYACSFFEKFKQQNFLIGWGIGLFQENSLNPSMFKLLGLRDCNRAEIDNKKVFYVPCVSCLNKEFDNKYSIKRKIAGYFHKVKTPHDVLKDFQLKKIPYLFNEDNFKKVIKFMGEAEYVVTNSYHGVYWATLLNKKVICIPYNSKFYGFKHPPIYADFNNWQDKLDECKNYPDALLDCRQINLKFYQKVKEVLNV